MLLAAIRSFCAALLLGIQRETVSQMRRTNSRQAGFTIVELMIVIMIIGVLAALVLPGVRANSIRARMSEAILALSPCKNAVTELYNSGGDPPGPGNWGCEASDVSMYVDTVTTDDVGVIKASLRGFGDLRIDFHDLTLAPLDNTGGLPAPGSIIRSWRCGSPSDWTGTNVPSQFLPGSCRG
ncbi:MAG: pilin [Betaproteobacteria bacterium]|nr:MAG: pilin [Betaproteobacteria bacterium]TMH91744.1 MAG: pilin [Betaproteobacteria bacterium]